METKITKNYTEREKEILVVLVQKYQNVIENKKTDAISNAAKKIAWEKVHAEFNIQPHVEERKLQSLQKAWENIKRKRKQDVSKWVNTGGGTYYESPITEDNPELDSRLNAINMENGFGDGDFFYSQSQDSPAVAAFYEQQPIKDEEIDVILSEREEDVDLKVSETHPPTKKSRNSFYGSRVNAIDEESSLRKKRLEEQIKQDAEVHKKKMELMEVELKIGKEKLESCERQLKAEMEKAEHDMAIRKLQIRQEEAKTQEQEAKLRLLEQRFVQTQH